MNLATGKIRVNTFYLVDDLQHAQECFLAGGCNEAAEHDSAGGC